ncbi:acetyltransferase (GNAT) family protein [Stackebrandtia albiflava]|uniref:Acetyltransferase (GNAT) family protein n=1 Tax=Stackebrandtia albiflava TaxID=406432 RepID=A0A562VDE1_9ACTN|nr:GNAT family N-acetyltransferase [Stackebrandtia albiflava]TWJ15890.1 acetyltransferase (GNAT) family protein [Stackebrandtia albiflava]
MNDTTWDGVAITPSAPRGNAVVVRRRHPDGHRYLILHRAVEGVHHEGLWAWTTPSGMRQPGEAVLPAATRELHEETGIAGHDLQPVDLGRGHALWLADIPSDTPIRLDAEHDRHEWVTADTAAARCLPSVVGHAVTTAAAVPTVHVTLPDAPTTDHPWCPPHPATHTCPVTGHHVTIDGRPAGTAHTATVGDLPDHLAATGSHHGVIITDPAWRGRGIGPAVIWALLRHVAHTHPHTTHVITDSDPHDTATHRALAKTGFTRDGHLRLPGGTRLLHGINPGHWLGHRPPNTSTHDMITAQGESQQGRT